jgi:hypothetical protein
LRRSFYVPLVAQLKQVGLMLDAVTANIQVRIWLKDIANERVHGTTQVRPIERMPDECLQPLPAPWRGDIRAARPQREEEAKLAERPVVVVERIAQVAPAQHPLAIYEQLLEQIRDKQGVPT